MSNIEPYLEKIRTAVRGEEVRGSIVDAIAADNDEVNASIATANTAISRANTISSTLEAKLKNGDFRGAQGESGVVALASGMFYLSVSNGVLYCEYLDGATQPQFELTDGVLYYVI